MSSARANPICRYCQTEFDNMDDYTSHVADEHDAFTKAVMDSMANPTEVYPDA